MHKSTKKKKNSTRIRAARHNETTGHNSADENIKTWLCLLD